MTHNCHGKKNNLAAKEIASRLKKDSRQKEEPLGKKEKTHGKRKNLTAKRKDSLERNNKVISLAVSY